MQHPEPQGIPFMALLTEIDKGVIKIPQFQRDFVWPREKSARLIDSIAKGFPIGTFILWKTKEELRSVRNIGDAQLPATPKGDYVQHVLDGQQRLTSLYATVRGLKVARDERVDDFSDIYLDLAAAEDDDIAIVDRNGRDENALIKVVDLMRGGLQFLAAYPPQYHRRLDELKTRFESYSFSTVLIKDAPIDVATEIFTRINVTGQPLSPFEIMVAKTFDVTTGFDLAEQYEILHEELANVGYDTIPPTTILQAMSLILTKECRKRDILRLPKSQFIENWPRVADATRQTVDYLRSFYRIPASRLLPYNAIIIPFVYYFYNHPQKPGGSDRDHLRDLFWRISVSGRYSFSLESRLSADIRRVDSILAGHLPSYDYAVDTSAEFIRSNGWFTASRSFCKAMLCIMAARQPQSFNDGAAVYISNDWLKKANSRNYHHFFPRAFLKRKGYEDAHANHVANITIVDDFLNKVLVRDKAPSKYMKQFLDTNTDLHRIMKTHLIDLESFGVWEDDYDTFLWKRCVSLSQALGHRIIKQDIDGLGQDVFTEDFEEAGDESAIADR
ncbi:MAG: DUF262 domain-containing protein [bacterium]|nr:DUF262 domain-containing protein [bacterium]